MKSFLYGIATIILCSFFLVYQTDINQMQREGLRVYETANEAANAAALQLVYYTEDESDIHTYSDGYIEYVTADAFERGFAVAKENMRLDDSFVSSSEYYSDNFEVSIYLFNESGAVYKSTNGSPAVSVGKTFVRGMRATEFVSEIPDNTDVVLNYPCVVCVIDAGKPRFRIEGLSDNAKIKKMGIYEYKDATGLTE